MVDTTVAFTGHRPNKMPVIDYLYTSKMWQRIKNEIDEFLERTETTHANVGGALGLDTVAAQRCEILDIPFTVYAPFRGQEKRWPGVAKEEYYRLLDVAANVVYVHDGDDYNIRWHFDRDEAMVDNADMVFAVYDPSQDGGTRYCVNYAKKQGKSIWHYDPVSKTVGWMDY